MHTLLSLIPARAEDTPSRSIAQASSQLLYLVRFGSADLAIKYCTWSFILMKNDCLGTMYQITAPRPSPTTPSEPVAGQTRKIQTSKSCSFNATEVNFLIDKSWKAKLLGSVYLCEIGFEDFWSFFDALDKALPATTRVSSNKEWKLSQEWVVAALPKLVEKGFKMDFNCFTKTQVETLFEGERKAQTKLYQQ